MTPDIPMCEFCGDRPLVTRSDGTLRKGATTCGDAICQRQSRAKYARETYKDPVARERQKAMRAKSQPNVRTRVMWLLKELANDPCIPKAGALKTLANALYGKDRFVNESTVCRRRKRQTTEQNQV